MRKLVFAAAITFGMSASAQDAQPIERWAGEYNSPFPDNVTSEAEARDLIDTLQIEKIDATSAIIRVQVRGPNTHMCYMEGVVQVEGDVLVHRGPIQSFTVSEWRAPGRAVQRGRCELTVRRGIDAQTGEPALKLEDNDQLCRFETCGARAYYDGALLPVSSRTSIGKKLARPVYP